jgi:signal recognition particle subunit SRP54
MSKMVKTMGGSKGLIKTMQNAQNTRGGMHPNQQAKMQSQMSKLLPPGMMEQLGGVSGLQSLMKQFDPKGDMSALQGMMGGLDMSALQGMMGGQGPSKPAGRKSRRK